MTNAAWENSVLAYNHPATCQVQYSGFADHSYIRGMSLAELEEHPNSLVNRFVLFSSVIEDSVCVYSLISKGTSSANQMSLTIYVL